MKGQKSAFLFLIAVISLIAIGVVIARGFLKKSPQTTNISLPEILGEQSQGEQEELSPTPIINLNKIISDNFQSTKEVAQQKIEEVQKTVITTVEKEISTLTQSQVEALKLQICRNWGVISVTPSKTP